jgi:hypothetical protein
MFDEDFDPDYDPANEQRLYQATPTMEAHTADEGRRVHVHVVDGAGGQLHAWGAAPDAVITARDPQHGRRLADIITGQPVTAPDGEDVDPDTGAAPAWVDQRALAADIADLLARGGYPITPTADQVLAALPQFLDALAQTSADAALGVLRAKLR